MSNVELVIKIDEKIIQQAKHYHDLPYDDYVIRVAEAVANGTPLPKGHGDLVDFDKLCEEYWDGNYLEIHRDELASIQPIIEADKESEYK